MWTSCRTSPTPSRTSRWRPGSSWSRGVLVCAPTGTGKTLIAEAALFEALHTGKVAHYTTPLFALTEQKFQEMQDRAVEWGFRREAVGLVTGSRKVNSDALVLVVVAEILLNRLRSRSDFSDVMACVMDEFHHLAEEVMIFRYLTEGSFDAYTWQALETKVRFIAQVMSGDCAVRKPRISAGRNSFTPR